jgi:hypothetical protein
MFPFILLLLFLLFLALNIPKSYVVQATVKINKPKDEVLNYIKKLQNQLEYSEWLKPDPGLQIEMIGKDGTVGAIQRWKSAMKNMGEGEQEIKTIGEHVVEIEIRFKEPVEGICQVENRFVALNHTETQYTCTFFANAKFPMNIPSYLFGRSMIKKTQQKNLDNVKQILEAKSPTLRSEFESRI